MIEAMLYELDCEAERDSLHSGIVTPAVRGFISCNNSG